MSVLYLRDKDGNITPIPTIRGKDGLTPYIGENGNWWIGDADTSVKAEGVNGKDGKDYILTDDDKAEIVQSVMDGIGCPVYGFVGDDKIITLKANGNLPEDNYTIRYEMEDGSTVNIGNLVLDNNVYYSVTNNLTNCTISNSATSVIKGNSYSATISANSGYELKSITVTMGGSAVSVTNGVINIANITGNIVITAMAEKVVVEIINQIPNSINADGTPFIGTNGEKGYKTGYRLSSSSGGESVQSGVEVTGFIPAKKGDTLYMKGITSNTESTNILGFYNANFEATKTAGASNTGMPMKTVFGGAVNGELRSVVLNASNVGNNNFNEDVAYIRISADVIDENSIITINQPIE